MGLKCASSLVLLVPLLGGAAAATTLFDTDVIRCDGNVCGGVGFSPGGGQAGRFTLAADSVITGIEVWTSTLHNDSRRFTLVLYGGGAVPDTASEHLAETVLVEHVADQDAHENSWQGVDGLSTLVPAGSYWLSVELRDGDDYNGFLPSLEFGALHPAEDYALYGPETGWDTSYDEGEFAFRIEGNVVPEPATGTLVGLGFASLAVRVRLHRARRTGA